MAITNSLLGENMYLPNCNIIFTGLEPTDKTRMDIELVMQSIQERSPSDGTLRLCIVSGENDVNGFLSIISRSEKFESCKIAQSALKVAELLKKDLLKQLSIWVGNRDLNSRPEGAT